MLVGTSNVTPRDKADCPFWRDGPLQHRQHSRYEYSQYVLREGGSYLQLEAG
jgi:hypothetical protein